MQALQLYREVLLRDIAGLDTDALDWQPVAQATSIATGLLHIAAVEFLIVASIVRAQGRAANPFGQDAWRALRPGFARELGEPPCRGKPLAFYLSWLQQARDASLMAFARDWIPFDPDLALAATLDQLDLDPEQRRHLQMPLGLPFSAIDTARPDSLALALIAHESYHRGQITQSKFRYRLAQGR
jgi:uncharacterized damage-inducible protein DinB